MTATFEPPRSLHNLGTQLTSVCHSGADHGNRYVAEENIIPLTDPPSEALMQFAGKYFKRWDREGGRFVSNMRDEYPDD